MGSKVTYIVNRRRATRHPVNLAVELRPVGSDERFLLEFAHNISRHGIFLGTEKPLPLGTAVELVVRLPEEDAERLGRNTLKVDAKVVWINGHREGAENLNPGMGLEFQPIDDETLGILEKVIRQIAVMPE